MSNDSPLSFVDLFAGCGGLSLGLMQSGWNGCLAIERNDQAFYTYYHNLVKENCTASHYGGLNGAHTWLESDWASNLICYPKFETAPTVGERYRREANVGCINQILENHGEDLKKLSGQIDLVAGGPPCQGFSSFGKRNPRDERNSLFKSYYEFIRLVQPKLILFENVVGITRAFSSKGKEAAFAEQIEQHFEGYTTYSQVIRASECGVPQIRPRFIMIGARNDLMPSRKYSKAGLCHLLEFSEEFGLPVSGLINKARESVLRSVLGSDRGDEVFKGKPITLKEAITDLETCVYDPGLYPTRSDLSGFEERFRKCDDPDSLRNYWEIEPKELKKPPTNAYLQYVRRNLPGTVRPNSLRLASQSREIRERYRLILDWYKKENTLRKGAELPKEYRLKLEKFVHENAADPEPGILKKQILIPLDPDGPSRAVTSNPDDHIHYSEPRTLTPRENARIQSFPDWFEFKGKFTTGGDTRKVDVPRNTQVGNAVPPLLARVLGESLKDLLMKLGA